MKPFEAKAGENTCNVGRENQPKRKYYLFPVSRCALAETLVALANTERVREISIGMFDGEFTVNFRFLEEKEEQKMIIKYYYGENADEFEFETDCQDYLNLFSKEELVQLISELVQLISERKDLEEILDINKLRGLYAEEILDIDKMKEFYANDAESELCRLTQEEIDKKYFNEEE